MVITLTDPAPMVVNRFISFAPKLIVTFFASAGPFGAAVVTFVVTAVVAFVGGEVVTGVGVRVGGWMAGCSVVGIAMGAGVSSITPSSAFVHPLIRTAAIQTRARGIPHEFCILTI